MKIKNSIIIFLAITFILKFNCHQSSDQIVLVVQWKDQKISLSDFERSYFLFWQTTHLADSPELRRNHARHMLEQQIIVENCQSYYTNQSRLLQKRVKRDSDRFIRRRYLEIRLKDNISNPIDSEVEIAMARQKINLYVQQIYAPNENGIQKAEKKLKSGVAFDRIVQEIKFDKTQSLQAGALGWIGWGDTDLPVEDVLFQLKIGEVSSPVQSLMGWHIFRVDSIRKTLQFGEISKIEYEQTRAKLRDRNFDMAVAHHLREMIWKTKLIVNMKILNEVWKILEPGLPKSSQQWNMITIEKLTEIPSPNFASQTVATVNGEPFTVQEFFDAVPDLPRNYLQANLKKALEIAIRDKILTQKAFAEGFDKDPVVKEKINRTRIANQYAEIIANAADSLYDDSFNLAHQDNINNKKLKEQKAISDKSDLLNQLHQSLLPKNYKTEDIIFYDENLKQAFRTNKTIF